MGVSTKIVASQIIPLANDYLILPNTAVAEIIGHTKADALPSAIKNAPDWLIGLLAWRGVSVPLLSFDTMLGGKAGEADAKARIAVINGISEDKKVPFFAIATKGIPRLVKIDSEHISTVDDNAESNPAVICHVVVDGDVAIIPDIEYIEAEVARVFSASRPGGGNTDKKNKNKKK